MIQRICALLRWQPPVADNRGLLGLSGATVPTDDTDGYQTGCLFLHTDGGNNTALYVNEGSVTACQFNAVTTGGPADILVIGAFASLLEGSGIALSSTQTSAIVAYGDDAGLSIASNVYNVRSRLLLTVDQDGASIRALMAQLKLADGVDVSTGIYTASQGYVELAGSTAVETGATFSCFDASLEIASGEVLTVDSGGEACGLHVETTGAGTITNNGTCAAILVKNASGAPDWPIGLLVDGPSATCGISVGQFASSQALGSAVRMAATTHTAAVAVFGETAAALGAGYMTRAIRGRHLVNVSGNVTQETYGVQGQLVVTGATLQHLHAGVLGTIEAASSVTLANALSYSYAHAGVMSRVGGVAAQITATEPLCGFLAFLNDQAGTGLGSGSLVAYAAYANSTWTTEWDIGFLTDGCAIGLQVGTCTTGITVDTCTTAIAVKDVITISPEAADTVLLDFVLETEWTTGTMIRADFASSTTYSGAVVGIGLDLGANIVATSEQSVKGVDINLPAMTMDNVSPTLVGVEISAAGAFTLATGGAANFFGVHVTTPAITETAGTVIVAAIKLTGGAITTGTAYGTYMDGAFTTGLGIASTVTTGIAISGTTGTGISISACTTAAVHILGDQAIGILFDVDTSATDGLKIDVDSGQTLTAGINIVGLGTVTTGITLAAAAGTTGIAISGTACTTGITISAGSMTDGIKVSGTTPEDGVEVSSACTQAAFHSSSTSNVGLLVAGDCVVAAISISGDQVLGVLFHATVAATAAYAVTVPTGITLDKGLDINCTSTGVVTSGLTMQGTGTVTTGITLSMAASTTGILISATACATGISITAGSLTDGIKISGATPVDGVEVSSVCSAGALHVSTGSASGLLVSGDCTTAAINITATACPMGILYNVDQVTESLGAWVTGMKVILERTADVVVGTSGIIGAEIIIKQGGVGYATAYGPVIKGLRVAIGGDNAQAGNVWGIISETQTDGAVRSLLALNANSGTVGTAMAEINATVNVGTAVHIGASPGTIGNGIKFDDNVGTGTITNLITINARNTSFLLHFAYDDGPISAGGDSTNCTHKVAVSIEGGTRYIHLFSD